MHLGWGAEGIKEEVESTLESASLCSRHKVESLAIPEASVIFTAQQVVNNPERNFFLTKSPSEKALVCRQSGKDIAQAVSPSLRKIARGTATLSKQADGTGTGVSLTVREKPDSHCDPLHVTVVSAHWTSCFALAFYPSPLTTLLLCSLRHRIHLVMTFLQDLQSGALELLLPLQWM